MKSLLSKIGLAAGTFLLLVVILEVGLSMAGYGNLELYSPDPNLYWKLTPNQNVVTKVGKKPVRINSHGTRGEEFETSKPVGTFRVLCLGDSRTYGWGLAEDETYSKRLEVLLQGVASEGTRVEVINAGVNAWSYPQMLVYLKRYALEYSPDIVVIDGANLWTVFGEDQTEAFKRSFRRKLVLKNLLRRSAIYHYFVEVRLRTYYDRYRKKLVAAGDRPDEQQFDAAEKALLVSLGGTFQSIDDLLRAHGVELVFLHTPREDEVDSRRSRELKRLMSEVAARNGRVLVDATDAFATAGGVLFQEADPIHPNAAGNAILADVLWGTVDSLPCFASAAASGRPTNDEPSGSQAP
jgi:lysophospholipase L1-like esterase